MSDNQPIHPWLRDPPWAFDTPPANLLVDPDTQYNNIFNATYLAAKSQGASDEEAAQAARDAVNASSSAQYPIAPFVAQAQPVTNIPVPWGPSQPAHPGEFSPGPQPSPSLSTGLNPFTGGIGDVAAQVNAGALADTLPTPPLKSGEGTFDRPPFQPGMSTPLTQRYPQGAVDPLSPNPDLSGATAGTMVPTGIPEDILMSHRGGGDLNQSTIGALTEYPYQAATFDPTVLGGLPEWMTSAGLTQTSLNNWNPLASNDAERAANQLALLDIYAQQNDLPGDFGTMNADLYASIPGLYAINHPDDPILSPAEYASMAAEMGPGGSFGTPGKFLDVGATWDRVWENADLGTEMGRVTSRDMDTMNPDQQVGTVQAALSTLSPYLDQNAAGYLQENINRAAQRWREAKMTGQTPYNFMDYMRNVEHADEWM